MYINICMYLLWMDTDLKIHIYCLFAAIRTSSTCWKRSQRIKRLVFATSLHWRTIYLTVTTHLYADTNLHAGWWSELKLTRLTLNKLQTWKWKVKYTWYPFFLFLAQLLKSQLSTCECVPHIVLWGHFFIVRGEKGSASNCHCLWEIAIKTETWTTESPVLCDQGKSGHELAEDCLAESSVLTEWEGHTGGTNKGRDASRFHSLGAGAGHSAVVRQPCPDSTAPPRGSDSNPR